MKLIINRSARQLFRFIFGKHVLSWPTYSGVAQRPSLSLFECSDKFSMMLCAKSHLATWCFKTGFHIQCQITRILVVVSCLREDEFNNMLWNCNTDCINMPEYALSQPKWIFELRACLKLVGSSINLDIRIYLKTSSYHTWQWTYSL